MSLANGAFPCFVLLLSLCTRERKKKTLQQLKKVQNTNAETNEEEKGN